MNSRAKTNPGDWWLGLGGLALLGALIVAPIVLFAHMPRYAAFRDTGLVTEALVTAKDSETSTSTSSGRRQRTRSSTDYFLEVSFSSPGAVPYADYTPPPPAAAKPKSANPIDDIEFGYAKSAKATIAGPLDGRAEIKVAKSLSEAISTGDKVSVVFLKDNNNQALLFEQVRDYSPALPLGGAALFGLIGAFACRIGWRKRQAGRGMS